jgi:metallo-beta-lactamase family protein
MYPSEPPGSPDWVVIESTYGDRLHEDCDPIEKVAEILARTISRGGTLLIPSFAVGRAQTLLYCFYEAFRRELVRPVPVFVNSPMATNVTQLFRRSSPHHRLSAELAEKVCRLATYVRSPDDSRKLSASHYPSVIISASGMASGGRVLHHLKSLAPDHRNTILVPGFQAPGTRGAAMVSGARSVKIHGSYVPVRAEVVQLDVFSAHADQRDLLAWIGRCEKPLRGVFVTHGEAVPADILRRTIQDRVRCPTSTPEFGECVELG